MKRAMPPAVTQHPGAHSTKKERTKEKTRKRERERERKKKKKQKGAFPAMAKTSRDTSGERSCASSCDSAPRSAQQKEREGKKRCSQLRPCVQGHTKEKRYQLRRRIQARAAGDGNYCGQVARKNAQWFIRNLLIGPWDLLVDDRTSSHGSMNLLLFRKSRARHRGDSGYSVTLTARRLGAGSLA